jgi:hypothetical protein
MSRILHGLYIDLDNTTCPSGEWLQQLMDCSSTMDAWYAQLPPQMRIDIIDRGERISIRPLIATLNVYYLALRIYLHGLAESVIRQGNGVGHMASDVGLGCAESVEKLAWIAKVVEQQADRLGWPFAWALWTGARYCLVLRYQEQAMPPRHLDQLLGSLESCSKYWQIAGHYLRLLRICRDELVALGTPGCCAAPSRLLLSVVDWRVASCELEDQGRVDPILRSSELDQTSSAEDMMFGSSGLETGSASAAYHGLTAQDMSDWFSMAPM